MRKFLNIKFLIPIFLIIATFFWYFFGSSFSKTTSEQYKLVTLEVGDLTQTVSANGTLNPVTLVNVGTQVSGTVKKLLVDFNDKVSAGQVMAVLDPALLDAQISQSKAGVENAKASLELAIANEKRVKELYKSEYVSKQEVETSISALKSAEAALKQSKALLQKDMTNLSYSVIKSPVSGVVIDRQIDVGQTVAASFQTPTLFKIAKDLTKMQIDSNFAEADIGKIKVGQKVRFNVDAFGNRSFEGVVKQVRLNATTVSNVITYDVVISVDNPDLTLLPSMTAYVNVVVAEKKQVLLVPNAALRYKPKNTQPTEAAKQQKSSNADKKRDFNSKNVYILRDGKPVPIKITIGASDNKMSEVVSGDLKAGDQVVVDDMTNDTKQKPSQPMKMF